LYREEISMLRASSLSTGRADLKIGPDDRRFSA
jgi:hypothetical protein